MSLKFDLGALGYPAFTYLRGEPTRNPAQLLANALNQSDLDSRVVEALPWVPIRQSHVQQDNVHSTFRKMTLGVVDAREMRQIVTTRFLLTEHLAEQASIPLVILNQKNLDCFFFQERTSFGNSATHSQKLSMLFTTLRNPSRSTGLVMKQFTWSR